MSDQQALTALTADIATSFLANNEVKAEEVGSLITSIYAALSDLGKPATPAAPEYVGAVSVRQSLASRDKIISMIDGKSYSMLKRHLTTNGLTPAEYRARYKLPADYPMIAPDYSQARSSFAKAIGFGRKAAGAVGDAVDTIVDAVLPEPEPEQAVADVPVKRRSAKAAPAPAPAPAKRGRKPAVATEAQPPVTTSTPAKADAGVIEDKPQPAKRGRPRKVPQG